MNESEESIVGVGREEPVPSKSGRGCLRGCVLVAVVVLALAGFSAFFYGCHLTAQQRDFVSEAEEMLREQQELRSAVPPAEDAGPIYEKAWPLYIKPAKAELETADYDKFTREEAVKYLADNAACLAALRAAAAKPGYVSPRDPTQGMADSSTHGMSLRRSIRLVRLAARHEAREGRPAEAVKLLISMLRISGHAGEDRNLISRMLQIGCEGITTTALENVLNDCEPAEKELLAMLAALDEQIAGRIPMSEVVRGDKAMAMVTLRNMIVSPGAAKGGLPRKKSALGTLFLSREGRNIQRAMEDLEAAYAKPLPEAIKAAREVEKKYTPGSKADMLVRGRMMIAMLMPANVRVLESEARGVARLRAMRLGLGCRLYRLKKGSYPQKLSDLSKAFPKKFAQLPSDPYTGKGMKYKLTATGCRIWSVGWDYLDQGGVKHTRKTRDACDIVFELKK